MNGTIDHVVDRLASIDFFTNVGSLEPIEIGAFDVVTVDSWQDAVQLRGSDLASDAFSEARGQLTRKLSAEFRNEYREWNNIARRIRQLFEVTLFPRIDAVIDVIPDLQSREQSATLIRESVRWDLLHYALEQAYSAVVDPSFYSTIVGVYECGRFPCNWDESWPDGIIWVF